MTSLLNKSILAFISVFFIYNLTNSSRGSTKNKIDKFEQHVKSLDYISRKTSDNKQYLNLARNYCDSILKLDPESKFAQKFKDKINLTLSANELNMNHRIQLFELLSGFPSYMAFADDPIEYAYDDAINSLLLSKEIDYQKGPIGDARFPSIVIRENCDDEMFEIANQIIIQNSSHYIIPKHELELILGVDDADRLINGDANIDFLESILKELNATTIGVFVMNDLDVIEEKIWYVQSSFSAYKSNQGFTQTIFSRGYNHDKRNIKILRILLLLIESFFLISIISFFDHYYRKIKNLLSMVTENLNINGIQTIKKELFESITEFLFLFKNKLTHVLVYFIVPMIFSFIMIYAISNLIPNPEADSREAASRLWLFALTIGMSLFPTFLNLILVNRLDLDGFHTIKGYRLFFNTSLYTTYFPISFFYVVKYDSIPWAEHLLLIIVTFTISWLLSTSYYRFTANSIHSNLKTQAAVGMIMAVVSLLYLNFFILTELSIMSLIYAQLVVVYFTMIYELIDKIIQKNNSEKELISTEQTLIDKTVFLNNVVDPRKRVYEKITKGSKNDILDIMILAAPMGMGKTATLKEAEIMLKKSKESDWDYYYGDCDEIQDEGANSYEPFLQAFGKKLSITQFSNRGEQIASYRESAIAAGSVVGVNTDILTDYERDQQKSMTETCVEIIEKLEKEGKDFVFVLEDLHFIDPETYSFLKHFIKIANNNKFIRESICIVLTLRSGDNNEFRGVNYETLIEDLDNLNHNQFKPFEYVNLYDFTDKKHVNLKDFVKHLSDHQNYTFKIQTNSLSKINDLFNAKYEEDSKMFYLTPLYIRKTIEGWIEDETLKFSPDGYLLTRTISANDLPNSDEADKYYHSIFESYDEKWRRLLESAAIIGNKFDAEILAKVWGYEFLDILSFLEKAVNDDLLIDLSKEDNMYKFKDKRIVSAIKSFFSLRHKDSGDFNNNFREKNSESNEKQIVIEYNKRYISLQHEILKNPENYSYETLMQVCRRLITLITNSHFRRSFQKLVLEIVVRLISKNKFDKLIAFSKFIDKTNGLHKLSKIIENFSYMAQTEILTDEEIEKRYQNIKKIYNKSSDDKFISHIYTIVSIYAEKQIDQKQYEFIKNNCLNDEEYSSFMSFEIIKKLCKLKRDFSYRFELLDIFKNSLSDEHLKKYEDKVRLEKFWLHKLRNLQDPNQKSNPYYNTWPADIVQITDDELIDQIIPILDLSNDFTLNADIIRLMNLTARISSHKDKFEQVYENLDKYLNFDKSLIIPLLLGILKHQKISKKYIKDKSDKWVEIENYFSSRYHAGQFNKLVKLYYDVKFNELMDNINNDNGEILSHLKSYSGRLKAANISKNSKDYVDLCTLYVSYYDKAGLKDKWFEWQKNQMKAFEDTIKSKPNIYLIKDIYRAKLTNFVLEMYLSDYKLKSALTYSKKLVNMCQENKDVNYFDSLLYVAFINEKLKDFIKSIEYYNLCSDELKNSNLNDKDYRIAYYELRCALCHAELNIKKAIPLIKKALKSFNPERFKNILKDYHLEFINKAKKLIN